MHESRITTTLRCTRPITCSTLRILPRLLKPEFASQSDKFVAIMGHYISWVAVVVIRDFSESKRETILQYT